MTNSPLSSPLPHTPSVRQPGVCPPPPPSGVQTLLPQQMCAIIWISGVYVCDYRIGTVEPCVNSDGVWHVRIYRSNTTYVHT